MVYAGDAFLVSPLTDDSATLSALLPALTTDLMPAKGSRADLGLRRAGVLLEQAGLRHGGAHPHRGLGRGLPRGGGWRRS